MRSRSRLFFVLALAAHGLLACAPRGNGGGAELVRVEHDVAYSRRGEQDLLADVYTPTSGTGPFPGVLVVHGGSWQRGRKENMASVAQRLAAGGFVAVSINYRLAPAHRYPAQLYDCKEAVRWMRRNADRYRIDPARIGAFGYSAGAHLVALLATTGESDGLEGEGVPDEAPSSRIQAAVAGGTPTDLFAFSDNPTLQKLIGGNHADAAEMYERASPVSYVDSGDAPMFLYHGRHDWIVDVSQAREMFEALQDAGVPAEYHESVLGHAVTFLFDDEDMQLAIKFLDRWLKGKGAEPDR